MIVGLSYIDYDQYNKFHDYGGIQGFVLIIFRMILYSIFLFGCYDTLKTTNKNQTKFIKNLRASTSLYLLAFPILWIV